MLACLAAKHLVVLVHNGLDQRLVCLLVEAHLDEDCEVSGLELRVGEQPSAREDLLDPAR